MQRTYGIRTVRLLKRVYRQTNCVWYGSEYFLLSSTRRNSDVAPLYGISLSLSMAAAACITGTLTRAITRAPRPRS